MKYYFMAFVPQSDAGYAIFSPDFKELASQGATLPECMDMAQEALELVTSSYAEQGDQCPEPCDLDETIRRTQETLAALGLATPPGIIYQLVPAPVGDLKPVRISATFSRWMLDLIDLKAKERGMSRSGFLAAAARTYE